MSTTEQLNAALNGRYAIDRLVGEGGMATVYVARDVRHNRRVALKVLKPDLGAIVGVDRFLSEIQVTANLQHPNLLPLFDSGAVDHLLFYVMPCIEGESLRTRLEREKQLPVEEAVRIATAVGSALDYAHRHGVIHRDLKPENILLHEGQPLVADFGIALAVSNAGGNRITQTGLSLGTPQYMSPEQATGDRTIDGRTDIYSLGALTYEMLTGEPPHVGSTSQAVIARLLTEKPRSVRSSRPSVPEQVEAAVERALEKLPADRWATAKEFGEALTGARIATRSTTANQVSGSALSARPGVRELAAWALAAIAISAAAFLGMQRNPALPVAVPSEFEVPLPDSMDISAGGGGANSITISQDGSTIVFAAAPFRGARDFLYARRLDDRDVLPIRGSDSTGSPTLSPNGEEVLFPFRSGGRGAEYPLKVLALRGGTPRGVADSTPGNGQVSWTDAGQIIVRHLNQLWTVPAEGGPRALLAAPDSSRRHIRYGFPHALPGGKAALITIWFGGAELDSTMLGVVTIPDGRVTELGIRGTNPQYSGTGHIVYATSDQWIMAVPFSARSRKTTGAPFPVVQGVAMGRGAAAGFAVARNGTLAYRTGGLGVGPRANLQLYIVSRSGTEVALGAQPARYAGPRVSPDGRQIVVSVGASGGVAAAALPDLWRFDTSSKVSTRVTADSASNYALWSSDGERLLFTRPGVDSVVMTQPLYSGGRATPLLKAGGEVRAFSAPRMGGYGALRVGRAGPNAAYDIWIVHMDSLSGARPFLAEAYDETAPEVSPDGQLIAYVTNRTGQREVYVRKLPSGAEEVKVSVNGGGEPIWAPDSRELFYRSGITAAEFVMSARVTTAPRLGVTRRDTLFRNVWASNPNRSNYDVFPDGKNFVMLRAGRADDTAERARLVVLMNWHLRSRARSESYQR